MKIEPDQFLSEGSINVIPKSNANYDSKEWVKDLACDYDLCMVFPSLNNEGEMLDEKANKCLLKLRQHALDTFIYVGADKKKSIFVLIRTPLEKLRAFADIYNFSMLLDPVVTKEKLEAGNESKNIGPIFLEHQPLITNIQPFENIYGEYSRLVDESIFFRENGKSDPFSRSLRLKLTFLILQTIPPGHFLLSFSDNEVSGLFGDQEARNP